MRSLIKFIAISLVFLSQVSANSDIDKLLAQSTAPEGVVFEIVESDGLLAGVIDRLSQIFNAPREEIANDVIEMLQPFVDKQLLSRK